MELNAELFVAIGFVLFVALLGYLGVHKTITSALDGRISSITNELEEARRLRAEGGGRLDALLAVLRAVPYAGAVAPLLRALEATHGTRAAGQIAATLAAGGPEIRQALDAGLQQPGRGLLTPALAWLAA